MGEVGQQDGERRLVHLDAVPVGRPVQPHVLGPVTVGLLRGLQVAQDPAGRFMVARGKQAHGGFDQVAGPHEVIASQVVIRLREAPGDGKTRDDASGHVPRLVRPEHGGADPIGLQGVPPLTAHGPLLQGKEGILPLQPFPDVLILRPGEPLQEARPRSVARFRGAAAEAHGDRKRTGAGPDIDLSGESDVPVLRPVVYAGQLPVPRDVLPSVRETDESDGSHGPGLRAGHGDAGTVSFREEHRDAFVGIDPSRVPPSAVADVRRQKCIDPVGFEGSGQRHETRLLEHDLAEGVGDDLLFDAVPARFRGVVQTIRRNPGGKETDGMPAFALFLGEESVGGRHEHAHVPRAGLVDTGVIDLVEDPVAQREPHAAGSVQRGADALFRAGCPARLYSRPARGRIRFSHSTQGSP